MDKSKLWSGTLDTLQELFVEGLGIKFLAPWLGKKPDEPTTSAGTLPAGDTDKVTTLRVRGAYTKVMATLGPRTDFLRANSKGEEAVVKFAVAEVGSLVRSRTKTITTPGKKGEKGKPAEPGKTETTLGEVKMAEIEKIVSEMLATVPSDQTDFDKWVDDLTKDDSPAAKAAKAAKEAGEKAKKKAKEIKEKLELTYAGWRGWVYMLIPSLIVILVGIISAIYLD